MSRIEESNIAKPLTEPASPGTLSLGRTVRSAASQEEHGNDCPANRDAVPPLGAKLTVYRLLNMTIMFTFFIVKAILTYKGRSTSPTTLDWVSGGVLGVVLYWIGLHEQRKVKTWEWFFEFDLAPAIGYGIMCAIGTALVMPFGFPTIIFAIIVSLPMSTWSLYLLPLLEGDFSGLAFTGILIGFIVGTTASMCFLFLAVEALTRRVRLRVWARQCAMRLVDNYGIGVPLEEGYWWFGAIGMIVGIFCVFALCLLPMVMGLYYL